MKISIIVAVFNRKSSIERTLHSFVKQAYINKELIVIDGGSIDGTTDIIKSFESSISYWESKPDRGIYHAFNKGLKKATGDWIYFLGSDDYLWSEKSLSLVAQQLRSISSSYRLAYGKVALVSPNSHKVKYVNQSWEVTKKSYFDSPSICHQGVFHSQSLFRKHGLFNESFEIAGDYEMLLRELKREEPYFLSEVIVAAMNLAGASSISSQKIKILNEFKKARIINDISGIPFRLYWLYIKAVIQLYVFQKIFGKKITISIVQFYKFFVSQSLLK